MQIVLGHYPMTITQMNSWAKAQTCLNPAECERALEKLDYPKAIRIRRA